MNISQVIQNISSLRADEEAEIKRHKFELERIRKEIASMEDKKQFLASDIDIEKVDVARSVIKIYGEFTESGLRSRCVESAINDIADGCKHLGKEFYGVKIYSGFGEQRSDHPYGYGPRHGSIVFSVGLHNPRQELTEHERECALYYLINLKKISSAAKAA